MKAGRRTWTRGGLALLSAVWLAAAMPAAAQQPLTPTPVETARSSRAEPAAQPHVEAPNPALVALVAGGVVILVFVVLTLTGFFSPAARNRDDMVERE